MADSGPLSGRRARLVAAAVVLAACGPAAPPPAPRPASPKGVEPPPAPDLSGTIGVHRARSQGLSIPLPDTLGWAVDERGSWITARHATSSTELVIRLWREEPGMSRSSCEERARRVRELPGRDGAEMLEARRIDSPEGFDTLVEMGVVAPRPGEPVSGFLLAFGGRARRCFAYVVTTRAEGQGAGSIVARRLAAMAEVSLGRLEAKSGIEAPPREPLR